MLHLGTETLTEIIRGAYGAALIEGDWQKKPERAAAFRKLAEAAAECLAIMKEVEHG
jgi:hypothetical protein